MKKQIIDTKTYCSQVCLEADEPMAGTAVQVDVWIMLEYRRAWQAKALKTNTLEAATNAWIDNTVAAFKAKGLVARPQFIRRPQRQPGIALFVAQQGKLSGLTVEDEQALQKLDLVNLSLPAVAGPQYFVCTNAKRDLCCAKFGRPTFAALHKMLPDRAWQTTHVGGHRYAPNILVLPDANMYGRVMETDVAEFLSATEHKQVAAPFLRGNTAYSKLAQCAEHALLSQRESSLSEKSKVDTAATDTEAHKLLRETDSRVTFSTPEGVREFLVEQAKDSLRILPSCGKPEELIYPLTAAPVNKEHNNEQD